MNTIHKLSINEISPLLSQTGIIIPTYALHMDREYYPKPLKFDPERFNDENRSSIRAGTYFPFGIGRKYHQNNNNRNKINSM